MTKLAPISVHLKNSRNIQLLVFFIALKLYSILSNKQFNLKEIRMTKKLNDKAPLLHFCDFGKYFNKTKMDSSNQ